jgi:hypothetical protein
MNGLLYFRRRVSRRYLSGIVAATTGLMLPVVSSAAVIADWTFESTTPTSAGPVSPEVGAGGASGVHAGAAVFSSPAGNGSSHSYSSTVWAVGDSWQFAASATGFEDLSLTFDQTSSNTGPGNFQVEYSTDGVHFTNFGSPYTVLANATPNTPWSSGGADQSVYTVTEDLSSVSALDNAATVFFRLADSSTVAANGGVESSGGTDRVDNVIIQGTAVVPEPASVGLMATLAIGGLVRRRHASRR